MEPLVWEGVQLTETRIAHYGDGQPVRPFVPKDQVRRMRLRYGFQANRPFLMAGLGLVAFPFGAAGLLGFVRGCLATGTVPSKLVPLGLLALTFGSAWIVWDALKRGHYLEAETDRDVHRFPLARQATPEALRAFTDGVRALGYPLAED